MKISLDWLAEFVTVPRDTAELSRKLAMAGLPVESVTHMGGGFSGVVVAEVREKAPHPKADKLTLVKLFDGVKLHDVVCGASNVPAPGGKVLWARPGAKLPGGFEIGEKELRGVKSAGMICSETELGIGDGKDGIIVLAGEDAAAAPGSSAQDALGLGDVVLDVEVTPNRGDCLSHLGLARELGAIYRVPVKLPVCDLAGLALDDGEWAAPVAVTIQDAACRRYTARVITGLSIGPSPRWMRRRLEAVGVRPINNLVDVTNYVLFEQGQPLHAFDLTRVRGRQINVRRAGEGERLTTLDGQERTLVGGDLLICDAEGPVALAGVMGGAGSEVADTTRDVLLESANFDSSSIRRTAKRLQLHSESSHRFERGIDPTLQARASRRAARLLAELAGGLIARAESDVDTRPWVSVAINLRPARVAALLGTELARERIEKQLGAAGIQYEDAGADLRCVPPAHRLDLELEVDLIEEIARLHGYQHIPATLPVSQKAPSASGDPVAEAIRDALCAAGLSEAITYGFTSRARLAALRFPDTHPVSRPVAIKNPMREEQSVMRTSLMANLLGAVVHNLAHGERDVRLFEVGSIFMATDAALPDEPRHVAGVMCGMRAGWLQPAGAIDFYDAKGAVEALLSALRVDVEFVPARNEDGFLHPGAGAAVLAGDKHIGVVGEIHPETRDRLGLDKPCFGFELNLERLPAAPRVSYLSVERFPANTRDLSFFVDDHVPAARVRSLLEGANEPLLRALHVLEDYREPGKVPPGKKGMLWSLEYRAADRTLTDAEVDAAHERLVKGLLAELRADRR